MLTEAIVKRWMDEFHFAPNPEMRKLRLCYEKDGLLCVLAELGEHVTPGTLTDFVNGQENLIEKDLRRYKFGTGKRIPLGKRRELKDGMVIEHNMADTAKMIYAQILEAAKVFSG